MSITAGEMHFSRPWPSPRDSTLDGALRKTLRRVRRVRVHDREGGGMIDPVTRQKDLAEWLLAQSMLFVLCGK